MKFLLCTKSDYNKRKLIVTLEYTFCLRIYKSWNFKILRNYLTILIRALYESYFITCYKIKIDIYCENCFVHPDLNHAIIGIIKIIIIEMPIANILSLVLIAAIPDHSNAIFRAYIWHFVLIIQITSNK